MKNKFLALAAFGAAALGSAIVSTPANAQIPQGSGPTNSITVNVSVPEVLFLRTIQDINLEITAADLTGTTLTAGPGTPPAYYIGSDQGESPADSVNTASPFAGGFADGVPYQKPIPNAYIVWSNSPSGTYNVEVTAPANFTGPSAATVGVTVPTPNPVILPAEGLVTATAQTITLELTASDDNITAGTYTGVLTVAAYRP
jgi:hypothetical protein